MLKDTCKAESEFAFMHHEPGKLYMRTSYDPVLVTFKH